MKLRLLALLLLLASPVYAATIGDDGSISAGGGGSFSGTMTGDLEMGNTPYSIDGGTGGLAFDPDNDNTNEVTIDTTGQITATAFTAASAADPSITFDSPTATDTDYWMGVQEDGGGDDDDTFQIGDGLTPGTNPFIVLTTAGIVSIGSAGDLTPDAVLDVGTIAGGANTTLNLSDDDVAHGMTGQMATDAFFRIQENSTSNGGAIITGASENAGTDQPLIIRGFHGGDPNANIPIVQFRSAVKSGTTVTTPATNDTVFQISDWDGGTDWISILGNGAVGIGNTAPAYGLVVAVPNQQAITAGATITADACGTIKPVTSASAVTTNTTNTFTAPAAANNGCTMSVVNVGSNNITLDTNSNFPTWNSGDIVLKPNASIIVASAGSGSPWYQLSSPLYN